MWPRRGGGVPHVRCSGPVGQAEAATAYVSNEKGNSISIIDTDKLAVVNTVKVGRRPRGIVLSKDYSQLFICAGDDDTIQILDTKTLRSSANFSPARIPNCSF